VSVPRPLISSCLHHPPPPQSSVLLLLLFLASDLVRRRRHDPTSLSLHRPHSVPPSRCLPACTPPVQPASAAARPANASANATTPCARCVAANRAVALSTAYRVRRGHPGTPSQALRLTPRPPGRAPPTRVAARSRTPRLRPLQALPKEALRLPHRPRFPVTLRCRRQLRRTTRSPPTSSTSRPRPSPPQ
jgi:hypothetical protein